MTDTVPVLEPPRQKPNNPRKRSRRTFWRRLLFGVVLLFVVGIAGLMGWMGLTPAQALKFLTFGADVARAKMHMAPPPFGGKQHINILILGADVTTGGGDCRTDTIKFVSVDFAKPFISVMTIPRDTWVDIPDHGHGRINTAYELGGKNEIYRVAMAKTVISNLLTEIGGQPVSIDRYIRVQTGGFDRIVDALGGIDIDVDKQMDYDDPSQLLSIHLKPGPQHLNGKEAEGYVRFRHDAEGDYGRIRRQDKFMEAMRAKLSSPEGKSRMVQCIGPIMGLMLTDLSGSDLLALKELSEKVSIGKLQIPTVPTYKGAASVVEVKDTAAAAQVINEALNGPRPTVTVLNGTGQSGMARTVSEYIDIKAYNVIGLGNTKQPLPTSTVIASDQFKTAALSLATRIGVQTVSTTGPVPEATFGKADPPPAADITVVLGGNYSGLPQHAQNGAQL